MTKLIENAKSAAFYLQKSNNVWLFFKGYFSFLQANNINWKTIVIWNNYIENNIVDI